jgi:hypothetical protein
MTPRERLATLVLVRASFAANLLLGERRELVRLLGEGSLVSRHSTALRERAIAA